MKVQYAYTILYVPDVRATMTFYKNTLGFEERMLTDENDYGELDSGSNILAFASIDLGEANFKSGFQKSSLAERPFGVELAFTTDAVELLVAKAIENGAVSLSEPVTKPWGQKVGYVRDPNGFIIEICTPMGGQ